MIFKNKKIFLLSIILIIIFLVYRYGFFVVIMLFGDEKKTPPTHEQLIFSQREQLLLNSLKSKLKCKRIASIVDTSFANVYSILIFYGECDSLKNENKIENSNKRILRQIKKTLFNNDTLIIKNFKVYKTCEFGIRKQYTIAASDL